MKKISRKTLFVIIIQIVFLFPIFSITIESEKEILGSKEFYFRELFENSLRFENILSYHDKLITDFEMLLKDKEVFQLTIYLEELKENENSLSGWTLKNLTFMDESGNRIGSYSLINQELQKPQNDAPILLAFIKKKDKQISIQATLEEKNYRFDDKIKNRSQNLSLSIPLTEKLIRDKTLYLYFSSQSSDNNLTFKEMK